MRDKKLYKSRSDRKISGVCAGLANYLGIDVTVIRVGWALLALTVTGIPAYIVCAVIIPDEPGEEYDGRYDGPPKKEYHEN